VPSIECRALRDFLGRRITDTLHLDLEHQGLSGQRVIAIEMCDPPTDVGYQEVDFIAIFALAHNGAPHLHRLALRKILQGYLAEQFNLAFSKGIIGDFPAPAQVSATAFPNHAGISPQGPQGRESPLPGRW
jgi:hypothetical protein